MPLGDAPHGGACSWWWPGSTGVMVAEMTRGRNRYMMVA